MQLFKRQIASFPIIMGCMLLAFGCQQEEPISGQKEPVSQTEISKGPDENGIYSVVEDQPEPVGGMSSFYRKISNNLKYPKSAREAGIEGKVFVQFVVNEKGELTNFKVLKGFENDDYGLHKEAKEVLQSAGKWKPGKTQDGKPVKVRLVMPITFKL